MEEPIDIAPLFCTYGDFVIPQRYVLMVMLHLSLMLARTLRSSLVVVMNSVEDLNNTIVDDTCPDYESVLDADHERLAIWPVWVFNYSLNAFFIGYSISQIPGGLLADKFGGRHVLGISLLLSGVLNCVTPAILQGGSHTATITIHLVNGFFQGSMVPAISSFLQHWAPSTERASIGGIVYGGREFGVFLANICTGHMTKSGQNWATTFYVIGICTILWYVLSLFFVFSEPSTHPFINDEELEDLDNKIEPKKKVGLPFFKILTSGPVWAVFIANFANSYTEYTIEWFFTAYLHGIVKMDIRSNPMVIAMPFLSCWFSSFIFSWLSDYVVKERCFSILGIRKLFTVISIIGTALCTLTAVYMECSKALTVTLYVTGMFLKGAFNSSVPLISNDLSRYHAGFVMGLVNGFAYTVPILGPWTIRRIVSNGSLIEWQNAFWIMFALCIMNTIIFLCFAKAERQPWDFSKADK